MKYTISTKTMLALDTDIMAMDTIRVMNEAATAPFVESKRIGTARNLVMME
ncbi:hypothetical protein [Anaerobacillus sp. 1_MG-2023]|uniref:hypothetical protein n=1 Tax=Bacillales TaxID=1385 RepID=UPI0026E3D2F7|nr:hypothetical protein [Anaerobacillus sp. 1_MG-2023]MDO6656964.1 hypothetical protein [Anaerobacillus sp. 1_MG-2023]